MGNTTKSREVRSTSGFVKKNEGIAKCWGVYHMQAPPSSGILPKELLKEVARDPNSTWIELRRLG